MKQPPLNWVIERLLLAEKTNALREQSNYYVFRANPHANSDTIRRAVEAIYDVKVDKVQTLNQNGKSKRRGRVIGKTSNWKKAYVRLAIGEFIEMPEQA